MFSKWRISVVVFSIPLVGLICNCRPRVGSSGSGSHILESRAPRVGETVGRPVMDETSFPNRTGGSWGRDGVEIEIVKTIKGLDTKQLIAFLESKNGGSDRIEFKRMAKPSYGEAFAFGLPGRDFEAMPWGKTDSETREANPYISLTVEDERLKFDPTTKKWEFSVGTDYNVDTYYDTPDFILLNNEIIARARNRMDEPGVPRRFLAQSKIIFGFDSSGVKSAAKKDTRIDTTDLSRFELFDKSIKSGKNMFESPGATTPEDLEALKSIYFTLLDRKVLPDLDDKKKVLLLIPQAYIFSTRARFHLDFTEFDKIRGIFDRGQALIAKAEADVAASSAFSATDKAAIQQKVAAYRNGAYLISTVKPQIDAAALGATPDDTRLSAAIATTSAFDPVMNLRAIVEERNKFFMEFSDMIRPLGAGWEVGIRQLRAIGQAGLSMWFSKLMISLGGSTWGGNFLIDTFDYTRAMTVKDFDALSAEQKLMKAALPTDKMFFATLVHETQIELELEKPFTKCIDAAKAAPADANLQKRGEACKFIMSKLTAFQEFVGVSRGKEVNRGIERAGIDPRTIQWVSGEASKGENVLKIAKDTAL